MPLTNWDKDMIYPYTRKFVLFDDIKDQLTGYVRMIEFRCLKNEGIDGYPDPSLPNSHYHNFLMTISEG